MTFYETITAAVNDIDLNGYDSQARVIEWVKRIRAAARKDLIPEAQLERVLRDTLTSVYKKFMSKSNFIKYHPDIPLFTLRNIEPKLHAEVARRVKASANQIKLNRTIMIDKTEQRFIGWTSSVPPGGSNVINKHAVKATIGKALKSLPFEERRVLIDQGHKLISTVNDIVAVNGNAIAGRWHSLWREKNYNYRVDHKDRDNKVYLIRDSWAHKQGLVKPSKAGYTDQITMPAEEVFCRCHYEYLYQLSALPKEMLSKKGIAWLAEARARIKALKK